MTWAQIILKVLQLLEWMIRIGQEHKWMEEGRQQEIARNLIETTRKHDVARKILDDLAAVPDAKLDDILRSLEPK